VQKGKEKLEGAAYRRREEKRTCPVLFTPFFPGPVKGKGCQGKKAGEVSQISQRKKEIDLRIGEKRRKSTADIDAFLYYREGRPGRGCPARRKIGSVRLEKGELTIPLTHQTCGRGCSRPSPREVSPLSYRLLHPLIAGRRPLRNGEGRPPKRKAAKKNRNLSTKDRPAARGKKKESTFPSSLLTSSRPCTEKLCPSVERFKKGERGSEYSQP